MSALDECRDYETPCTNCGGKVEYWHFEGDCRGNSTSDGIQCKKCGKKFTSEEWGDRK